MGLLNPSIHEVTVFSALARTQSITSGKHLLARSHVGGLNWQHRARRLWSNRRQ